MAKRFGRNQRRQLREQLQAERALRLWGAGEASPSLPRIEDMGVVRWRLTIDDDRLIERNVEVLVERIPHAVLREGEVAFQGARYMISQARMPAMRRDGGFFGSTFFEGGPDAMLLELTGVAS